MHTSPIPHELPATTGLTDIEAEEEASQLAIWMRFCQKVHSERRSEATRPRYSMSTGRFVDAHIPRTEQPSPQLSRSHDRQHAIDSLRSSKPEANFRLPQTRMRTTGLTRPRTRANKRENRPWSKHEDECCIKEMRRALDEDEHAAVTELWEGVSKRLQAIHGVDRSPWAVRTQWNRRLRGESELDERRHARSASLRTSLQ